MNCEEFEAIGLSIDRDGGASGAERAAAREHASACSRCASLQDAWLAAKLELSALGEATSAAETPERVEMRLRQEFRTRHRTMPARRAAVIAAWALATAAVMAGAVGWRNWQRTRHEEAAKQQLAVPSAPMQAASGDVEASGQKQTQGSLYSAQASGDEGEFTLLPGSVGGDTEDAAIWRVRMQRGALSGLGFPVNEDSAGEWIQVDLLVGDDGLPQGVRLVR
ncbi:MAG: hypothetical protein ACHQLQ_14635 [Candidatus Acidiferrales bacterium]